MTKEDLPGFDSYDDTDTPEGPLTPSNTATETIDLSNLFCQDVYSSGSFDLSSVGSSALGRLLDALPLPAFLIDQYFQVIFTNRSCIKIGPDFERMRGLPFLEFLPRPSDADRAKALADKTISILERVFNTRKPQVVETILDVSGSRIWARLHIRAVRIALDRHLMALVEDLTGEKKQIELSRRQEQSLRQMRRDLVARFDASNAELQRTAQRFRREVEDHQRTRRALRVEEQKSKLLSELSLMATATIAPTGTFQHIDRRFKELFCFALTDLPNFGDWIVRMGSEANPLEQIVEDSLRTLNPPDEVRMAPVHCTVLCGDGTTKDIKINGSKIADGNYFIVCEEIGSHRC